MKSLQKLPLMFQKLRKLRVEQISILSVITQLHNSQSTGKHGMKSQGMSKIGFNCPASIKVKLEENSSAVKATICSLHYGHDSELKHLRIYKSERTLIASQLSLG